MRKTRSKLQKLAEKNGLNPPVYTYVRDGPDNKPRFKAIVNFNGNFYEGSYYCATRQEAEHYAAQVALNSLFMVRDPILLGPSGKRSIWETGSLTNLNIIEGRFDMSFYETGRYVFTPEETTHVPRAYVERALAQARESMKVAYARAEAAEAELALMKYGARHGR